LAGGPARLAGGQVVPAQRRHAGQDALRPGVQQRRDLLRCVVRSAGVCQVYAWKQHLPGPSAADAVVHDAFGHAAFECLVTGDYTMLLAR
jgi:hypothetical protein